jgi:glucose-1-phosphatase
MRTITFIPYNNLNIKNIIFDLGGVILDIDYKKTLDEFKNLGFENIESIFTQPSQVELFNKFDCGLISAQEFRDEIRKRLNSDLSDKQIDNAWNALLLSWNLNRLNLLDELKKYYHVFLLSNTSIIHSDLYNKQLVELTGGRNLKAFFEKVYYS